MKCAETRSKILALDDEYDPALEAQVNRHLEGCGDCRRFRQELDQTWQALDGAPELEPATDFNRRVWQRIDSRRARPAAGWHFFLRPAARLGLAGWAALLVLAVAGAVVAYQFSRARLTAPEVQFTAGDLRDSEMLQELDNLLNVDETEFLNTFQDWDLSRDATPPGQDKPAPAPARKEPAPPPESNEVSRVAARAYSA